MAAQGPTEINQKRPIVFVFVYSFASFILKPFAVFAFTASTSNVLFGDNLIRKKNFLTPFLHIAWTVPSIRFLFKKNFSLFFSFLYRALD